MSVQVASAHVLVGANVAPALAGMAKVQTGLAGMAARGAKAGMLLSKAVTLPVVAGFAMSIKAAADFESSLNDMQAVSGATAGEMKAVGKAAKQLGSDAKLPGTSAKDAADAMVQLAKGGFTARQAMDAARGTLLLSAAAGIDNARAAEIQADALNGFGLKAKDANRVADLLAASANASTAEMTDMAMSLAQSSAVAKQAGVPIEDAVTALSRLANAGLKGSDAGTSLKTMLLRLMAPAGAGAKAIDKLGLSLRDQQGNLKSLPALAQEFTEKTAGMTKAQRDAAFAAIFGTDAIRAANVLLGQGAGAHERMKKKVTEQGAAQTLAAAKMKGFNGALERFKSAAETAAITVGAILLPMATSVANGLTRMVDAFESLPAPVQKGVVVLLGVAAAVGPLILLAAKFVTAVKTIGPAFALATGPVGLVVIGLAALAAGLIYAWRNSETFRNIVKATFSAVAGAARTLVSAFQSVLSWVRGNWRTIATLIAGPFAPLVALATNAFGVRSALTGAFQAMLGAVRSAMSSIVGAVRGAVGAVTGAARAVGRAIITGVKAGVAAIRSIFATMWTGISGAIAAAASAALGAAAAIGRAIISGAVNALGGLASALRSKVQSAISSALSNLNPFSPVEHGGELYIGRPIIDGAVKGIQRNQARLKMALTKTVRDAITEARQNASSLAGSLAGSIGQGIDALLGRNVAALGNSPEAQRLREIEAQQRAEQTARERMRLDEAIANAETDQDRANAQRDLNDWLLDQERQALADSLAQKEQALRDEADARKTAAERGIADLTDSLNRGLITQQQYLAGIEALIGSSVGNYAALGDMLGSAFVSSFAAQLAALGAQAGLIAGGPGVGLPIGLPVVDPAMAQWQEERDRLAKRLTDLRAQVVSERSGGGKTITKTEQEWIANATAALKAWNAQKPARAAFGGIVRGSGNTDHIPALLKPGEGVLDRTGMDKLVAAGLEGRGAGRGPTTVNVTVNVRGSMIGGSGGDRALARDLAAIIAPELNRRITIAG